MAFKDVGVRLVVEGTGKFKGDMKGAGRTTTNLKNTILNNGRAIGLAMAAMGTAILAAGVLSVKTFAKMGDEVAKMAKRTGLSTEFLSEWRQVAELSGTTLGSVEKATKRMSKAISDAEEGLTESIRAFDSLGLSSAKLIKMSPEDAFNAIAEALANEENELIQVALAQDLFGRAGTQLLPALEAGAEGIREMRQEARDLGIVFDAEAAAKAEEMTDAMLRLQRSMTGIALAIGEVLIPAIQPMIDLMTATLTPISAWLKQHPLLAQVILGFAAALAAVLIPLGTLLVLSPVLGARLAVLGAKFLILGAKSIAAAAGLIVKAIASLWAWAAGIPFAGIALGVAGAATIAASIIGIKSQMKGLAAGGEVVTSGNFRVGERGTEVVTLPAGSAVAPVSNETNYNLTANYTNPQEPQSITLDMEALLMLTRS